MSELNCRAADQGMELLRELVEIRSPSGGENAAVAHLTAWMRNHGFDAHSDEAGNSVGVLSWPAHAASPSATEARTLILLGHIDTVPGFPPVATRDGKLYGRGAVDAKGPLAAFATAAAVVGPRPGWRIVVVGAVEEEAATSKGARHIARIYGPDMAIIGEPTGWQRLALGYKGRLLADLTVRRSMAHRAGPHLSAPEEAIHFWNSVNERVSVLNREHERIWEQVHAGVRSFESSDDGLEETAHMELGFRLPLRMTPTELEAHLRSLANGHELGFHGEEAAFKADKNNLLVRAFLGAVRDGGGDPGFVVKTGTSDMNVVGPVWRCPIAAYGPGDSALDHTPDEHVDLGEWCSGVAVLASILRRVTASTA
jgi:LysW-gamma-L-lysine carboxypeptidase